MFDAYLAIIESTHIDDATGRTVLTLTPTLQVKCTASGSLTFAIWQVWQDQPETHGKAKQLALANARTILKELAYVSIAQNDS